MIRVVEYVYVISDDELEDAFNYYLSNIFGYKGIENFVEENYPQYSEAAKSQIIRYIKSNLR